jgi:hypothetical protein
LTELLVAAADLHARLAELQATLTAPLVDLEQRLRDADAARASTEEQLGG